MMSLLLFIFYLLGGGGVFWLVLELVDSRAGWRMAAALAAAVLWPGVVILLALSLLLDTAAWIIGRLRGIDADELP